MRKDFSPSEAVAIGEMIEAQEQKLAEQRKHEGQKSGGRGKKKLAGNFPASLETGQSRDIAAAAVGWSAPTYEKAKAVVHAARQSTDCAEFVKEMDQTGNVSAAYRKLPAHWRPSPRTGREASWPARSALLGPPDDRRGCLHGPTGGNVRRTAIRTWRVSV